MFVPGLVTGDIITKIGPAWTIILGMRGLGAAMAVLLLLVCAILAARKAKHRQGVLGVGLGHEGWTRWLHFTRPHSSRADVLLREHRDRVHQLPSCTAALRHGDMPRSSRGLCGAGVACR